MTDMSKPNESSTFYERKLFLDDRGVGRTQSLFLELGYNSDALYSLKEVDHIWNGKLYPSIKLLYVQEEDPTEYDFANKYFLGWKHWQRICENKVIRKSIDEWREELEVKLRSKAVKQMMNQSRSGKLQASKWLADRGWAQRGAGRPSKLDLERSRGIEDRIASEYDEDVQRMKE
jgi:hypothetical protein